VLHKKNDLLRRPVAPVPAAGVERREDEFSTMTERTSTETRELLLGTWTGMALIVDILIEEGLLGREEMITVLSAAGALAKDDRRIALRALCALIEHGFGAAPGWGYRCRR
jgi:hypothetical protein